MDFYQSNYQTYNPMMYDMDTTIQATYPNSRFVNIVNGCAAECFSTMSRLTGKPGRDRQLKLLHDCARICESQVIYTVVSSEFDKQHAAFCAMICETCGNECAKHPDELSQHCAKVCLHCARECKRFAGF